MSVGWIWTCRAGFEDDLVLELRRGRCDAHVAGAALVQSAQRPAIWPVFARAGFPVERECAAVPIDVASALAAALDAAGRGRPAAWAMTTWVPDADETNPLSAAARRLEEETLTTLARTRTDLELRRVRSRGDAVRYGGLLAQVCVASANRALVGALPGGDAPSFAPGGRARAHSPKGAPSRAARKLAEAFEWIGRGPEAGEACVDLGAAPGGWTAVLLSRRAKVIAVDPARLAPELRNHRGLRHVQDSAFTFTPEESVDWLFCDMAWRPLEVATLLAKWGRRRWATGLVANIKLPMRQRVEFVGRVVSTVTAGGWQDVRARHLYHDREEVTLASWRT